MNTVSMLEFRKDAETILQRIRQGEHLVLTYRGKAVARLEPIVEETLSETDPFYSICQHAAATGESLSNEDMDAILYGS